LDRTAQKNCLGIIWLGCHTSDYIMGAILEGLVVGVFARNACFKIKGALSWWINWDYGYANLSG
jgi:chitinase